MIQAALRQPMVRTEPREERRASTRFRIVLPASIRNFPLNGDSEEFFGKTMDISGRGIYFVTDAPFEPGTRFALTIAFPRKRASFDPALARARARVVWSEEVWSRGKRKVGVAAEIEHYCL